MILAAMSTNGFPAPDARGVKYGSLKARIVTIRAFFCRPLPAVRRENVHCKPARYCCNDTDRTRPRCGILNWGRLQT